MNLNPKQRKILWICLGILGAAYLARSIITAQMEAEYYQHQAIQRQKPKPAVPSITAQGATAVTGSTSPIKAISPPASKLPGVWRGRTAIEGRGICDLRFELQDKPEEPGHFIGYSALICLTGQALVPNANAASATIRRMDPEAAIFSGVMENGAIHFHLDKAVGSNGCPATSFTLTPFGSNQLAAEWTELGCQGGHAILGKARQ